MFYTQIYEYVFLFSNAKSIQQIIQKKIKTDNSNGLNTLHNDKSTLYKMSQCIGKCV